MGQQNEAGEFTDPIGKWCCNQRPTKYDELGNHYPGMMPDDMRLSKYS